MRQRITSSGGKSARIFPGAKKFIELTDCPASYAGSGSKFVTVKAGVNGLEFTDLPPLAITDTFVVASEVAMLALTAQVGDVAIRTDINQSFILQVADPSILAHWAMLLVSPTHAIGGALHTADSLANLKSKVSAPDTLLTSDAGEIAAFSAVSLANNLENNLLVLEDANDSNKKKKITLINLREIFFRFPEYQFTPDQMLAPISSDFPVNGANFASLVNDLNTNSLLSRQFDPATNEGIGVSFIMPGLSPSALPTNIVFQTVWRAETAQAAGKYVKLAGYFRQLSDNAAIPAWSAKTALVTLSCTTNVLPQYNITTVSLSSLSLTPGRLTQIELIRDAADAGDTCTSDFNLLTLRIAFS